MAWTNPKTWVASSPAGAAELNTHLRDNLNALKAPPTDAKNVGAHSTSSTSYVDVDSTNLSVTIETTGGDILVTFSGSGSMAAAGNFGYLTISVDGVDQWTSGITVATVAGYQGMSFAVWLFGYPAGSHTIKLRYKVSGSTLTIIGAGQFAAREAT